MYIFIFVEIGYNTMLYIIFQYGLEMVLIQRIIISFEAILESISFQANCTAPLLEIDQEQAEDIYNEDGDDTNDDDNQE